MPKDFFICKNCKKEVSLKAIGTKNRNHCSYCLWSLHVDEIRPGDRKSSCIGLMRPTSLMFKNEGLDKYGKKRQGEIMLVHKCEVCGKETRNRIAGDDDPKNVLDILEKTSLETVRPDIGERRNTYLTEKNKEEVERQLFGK